MLLAASIFSKKKKIVEFMQCMLLCYPQLVRQLQGQEENPFGDDASTTPKKIFQLLNQVTHFVPY